MASSSAPTTMRAWQYSATKGGLEKNLKLNPGAAIPTPQPTQNLVQVLYVALNPTDYKSAEALLLGRFLIPKPATPVLDFAGAIVVPATGSTFKRGDLVFGVSGRTPLGGAGALREFALTEKNCTVALPEGVDARDAATIPVAGLTAYQTIVPHVKKGDRIFINGGSGGTGVFGIQIGKAVGCQVTTTCSGANVELCKSLGADEVLDYKKGNVVDALKASGEKYDLIIDNVGSNWDLYWRAHEYSKPGVQYIMVGGIPTFRTIWERIKIACIPGFLGGGQRKFTGFLTTPEPDEALRIANWMKEGKVKAVVDSKFAFEDAPKAFERLRTGRAKGKIVVDVASETYQKP
ncbi:hypothetical protein G7Y89_g2830 [Cudoniella acicularis]|uniref:Enoyl reductase (ER) domain-containing protein n=1 Tax=Cudoniella acicularis TaxID=354080 RepID=A0A8H4W904_9HELO|nr:hypothetical protein G7Y89_g2830 [Cudoniella acicularis]